MDNVTLVNLGTFDIHAFVSERGPSLVDRR